jgi:hypothetical protein
VFGNWTWSHGVGAPTDGEINPLAPISHIKRLMHLWLTDLLTWATLSDLSSHLDATYEVVAIHSSAEVIQVRTQVNSSDVSLVSKVWLSWGHFRWCAQRVEGAGAAWHWGWSLDHPCSFPLLLGFWELQPPLGNDYRHSMEVSSVSGFVTFSNLPRYAVIWAGAAFGL